MKKIKFNKTYFRNVSSLLVIGVFVWIAMATIPAGTNQQKVYLGGGRWEVAKTYKGGRVEILTGASDGYEAWQGIITIEYLNEDKIRTGFEEVNMEEGKRHGISRMTYPGGGVSETCYNMGVVVECKKSAIITENSAYEIFNYKYPWFILKLNAFDFSDEYIKAFMDTVETVLNELEYEAEDFFDSYDDVMDELEETYFDSIMVLNEEITLYNGLSLMGNTEFRRAVIDRHRSGGTETYEVIENTYPNYLALMNEVEVTNQDFEAFCHVFDSLLTSYGELDVEDSFFLDSLDTRMFKALEFVSSMGDESSELANLSLKSAVYMMNDNSLRNSYKMLSSKLKEKTDTPPEDVATMIVTFMLIEFGQADLMRNTFHEAYQMRQEIYRLPVVTTELADKKSATSIVVGGYVVEDGGASVTDRGIAWATFYDPTSDDQVLVSGAGVGSFTATINGLVEGQTYYARSYATNSVGTVYGNCVKFAASLSTGNLDIETAEWNLKIFPNPAKDMVSINFYHETTDKLVLSVININGQIVKQIELVNLIQGENRIKLNISNLENGLYHCQLSNNKNVKVSEKLLIAR